MRVDSRELQISAIPVSRFHVITGCLDCTIECSTCPYQRSLLSCRMRSRSSMPSSSLDLMMSCGLTLQICLIIALSFCCRHWRFGFVNGQVSLAWCIAHRTQELYTRPHLLKERWWEERTGSSSLNFFQVVFARDVVESSQLLAAERGLQFPGIVYICNQGPLSSD